MALNLRLERRNALTAATAVVERYRLNDAGTRIVVDFMLEDPQYLAEPVYHTRELIDSPHLEMPRYDCDPEATRRFLRQ